MIQPTHACKDPAYAYVDLHARASTQKALLSLFFLLFYLFPYLTIILMFSFHLSCKSCFFSRVGEALTALLRGIGSKPTTQGPWYVRRALSPFFVYYWKAMLVPSWCSPWLKGGGTLLTPPTLLIGR